MKEARAGDAATEPPEASRSTPPHRRPNHQQAPPLAPTSTSGGSPARYAADHRASNNQDGSPHAPTTVAAVSAENAPGMRNVKNLGWRVGADCAAAASAGVLVAPVVTAIDRAIIENASGRAPLRASLVSSARTLLLRPHAYIFSRPFFLIFSLYTGTYLTANTLDTVTSTTHNTPASATTAGPPKFFATSGANLALCLYKDSRFTRFFAAPGSSPRPVPGPTYALFALRDCLTVFASFNVPPLLSPYLNARIERAAEAGSAVGEALRKHVDTASAAQFAAPALVQVFSTPLHLLGLDLYNRPRGGGVPWADRGSKVARDWGMSCLARMARIVPAFGFGGVINMKVRKGFMERLE